jgi:hypothetical protein
MSTDRPTAGPTGTGTEPPGDHVKHESNMLVVVSTAVLVFVAVALALAALLVHLNASGLQARADRIERETAQHVTATATATRDLAALHADVDHAYAALGALTAAYQAQLASQNHAIDVANGAADSYNAGQMNIADALRTEAQAAVADAEAKSAAVRAALPQVKQAFAALRQSSG